MVYEPILRRWRNERPGDAHPAVHTYIVSAAFQSYYAGQIALRLVENYLANEGYTASPQYVVIGPMIEQITFNYETVAEALDTLAELTGVEWSVEPGKQIRFGNFNEPPDHADGT